MFDPAIDLAGPAVHTMVSWLGTYFVHSTVLIGGVWMFNKFLPLDSLTRSLLWKMSLVGGLFTATLQTGLGVEPLFGSVNVETSAAPATVPAPSPPVVEEPVQPIQPMQFVHACVGCESQVSRVVIVSDEGVTTVISSSTPAWRDHGLMWAEAGPPLPPPPPLAPAPVASLTAATADGPPGGTVAWLLGGLFLFGATVSLGRLGVTVARLRGGLRDRTPLRGPLRERLMRLLAHVRVPQHSVQLTMSERIGSPIALTGREIVVPERVQELAPRQQMAMLAHELAHVLRRDPAWQVLAALIEAALFFQPLNRVARRGMQEAAEELCDDWAVRHTGSGVHLARCLTEVAGWPDREDMSGPFASPMAGRRSLLVRRVERLLDERERERGSWARRWRGLLGLALLAMVGLGAPGVSLSVARAETPALTPPTPPTPPIPPEPPAPPLAPEPVFAMAPWPHGEFGPVLAMAPVAPGADGRVTVRTPKQLSARQRRALRRVERIERRAERARGKAGVTAFQVWAPAVTTHESCADDDGDEEQQPRRIVLAPRQLERLQRGGQFAKLGAIGLSEQDIRALAEAGKALAEHAPHLTEAQIEALEARAEALAAEVEAKVEAQVEALNLDDIGKAVELEIEGLDLDHLSAQIDEAIERELRPGGHGEPGVHGRERAEAVRELKRALRSGEHPRARVGADAARGHGRDRAEAVRELKRALRSGEHPRGRAAADVQRQVERAQRDAAKQARDAAKQVRAGAAVQREVERALRDGTIDAEEARKIEEVSRRVAAPK